MTRAARSLGVTQPALSAMVKKLEREVGTALLHRTPRGVELTEAGRLFLIHADDAVRRADQAMAAVRQLMGLERGTIRVGGGATAITYLLPPAVSEIRKKHAGLRFFIREAGSAVRDVIDRAAADAGASLNIVMELRSIESIKQMVRAGIGVGFVSRFALGMEEGLTCRDSGLSRQMAIVRRRDRDLSPAARAFHDALLRLSRASARA